MGVSIAARRGLLHVGRIRAGVDLRPCARVGLPTAVTGVAFSLIYVVLTRTTTRFGTPALAALGIGHRVESWLFMIGVGFGAATAAIVGQNLGADRPDRAARAGWMATGYLHVARRGRVRVGARISAPVRVALHERPGRDREAVKYLRIAAVSQLAVCAEIVLEGALGGAGDTVPPMMASTALTASRVPLAGLGGRRGGAERGSGG